MDGTASKREFDFETDGLSSSPDSILKKLCKKSCLNQVDKPQVMILIYVPRLLTYVPHIKWDNARTITSEIPKARGKWKNLSSSRVWKICTQMILTHL